MAALELVQEVLALPPSPKSFIDEIDSALRTGRAVLPQHLPPILGDGLPPAWRCVLDPSDAWLYSECMLATYDWMMERAQSPGCIVRVPACAEYRVLNRARRTDPSLVDMNMLLLCAGPSNRTNIREVLGSEILHECWFFGGLLPQFGGESAIQEAFDVFRGECWKSPFKQRTLGTVPPQVLTELFSWVIEWHLDDRHAMIAMSNWAVDKLLGRT